MNINNCKIQTCIANEYVGNEYRQVTIRNSANYTAQFSLSYMYQGKFHSNTSSKFKSGKSAILKFPKGSTNITIVVSYFYNTGQSAFLYRESFNDFYNRCYLLQGTVTTPNCERVPCRCINNLYQCNPCCICKCNYYM